MNRYCTKGEKRFFIARIYNINNNHRYYSETGRASAKALFGENCRACEVLHSLRRDLCSPCGNKPREIIRIGKVGTDRSI